MWKFGKMSINSLPEKTARFPVGAKGRSCITETVSRRILDTMLYEGSSVSWYALQTRSRQEKLVRDRLIGKGVQQLLPLRKRVSQWSDRKKIIDEPLFSGFCFAKFSLHDQLSVLTVPGVVRIMGCHGPEAIPDEEMCSLLTLAGSGLDYEPHDYCDEGMLVEVIEGPLTGVRGVLIRKAGQDHVVVRVRLIHQSASVQVMRSTIKPVRTSDEHISGESCVAAPSVRKDVDMNAHVVR
jgi:transcription termination/antitermination protein NusG